jgi:hypothetical protein
MRHPTERFWFKLAARFGCTVLELKRRMYTGEFASWVAYYGMEPWDVPIEHWPKNVGRVPMSADEMRSKFLAIANAHNRKIGAPEVKRG